MDSYIDNDELLIHCFQDNLFGASLDWYMNLDPRKIRFWKDLYDAFLNQYKYNMDMAHTRLQLQNQVQWFNVTFKECVQRWCEMGSRVNPTLTDTELVDIFMETLQSLYYENMVGSSSSNFADLVITEERIENGLKIGKIVNGANQQSTVRRPSNGFTKKKEGETNPVTASVL